MNRALKIFAAIGLAAATLLYLGFVVPIWVIGQGLAGKPIFELHPMVLSVEAIGLLLVALWWGWVKWIRKPQPSINP